MKRRLDKKGQIGLSIGILAITVVVMAALYIPAGPRKAWLASESAVEDAKADLQMQQLAKMDQAERLGKQKLLMERLDKRAKDFSLFTFMDNLLNTSGLRNRAQLEQFKPRSGSARQPMVQLRLQGVAFKELVGLLHSVYSGGNLVAVYKMDTLRAAATEKGLDCDITLMTITQ